MPQLDGLRALAVSAVVLQHFELIAKGAGYGVHLFFVLSGFLITGILMKSRSGIEASELRVTDALRTFYIRRALRIFPLYYLVLVAAVLVNADYAREYAPWLFTYTINLKMAAQGWFIGNFAHFWSLAVEEQYYLFWPCLILLLPRKWLLSASVIMAACGPLYRLWLSVAWLRFGNGTDPISGYISTLTALDSLGIGSLVAIAASTGFDRSTYRVPARIAAVAVALMLILAVIGDGWWAFADTASAIVFGWLIYRASSGFKGIAGRVLSSPPLVFVGRISYGIYVFHPLVATAAISLATAFAFKLPPKTWPLAILLIAVTLLLSTVSWFAFERPINNLKSRFAPQRPRAAVNVILDPQAAP